MYLTRTPALPILRAQLAQSSRELGTVLLGLEAVKTGRVDESLPRRQRGAEVWPPWGDALERDAAVRHARRFVFDAALARVVDALDGYLSRLRRSGALAEAVPALALQERSVKARLDALAEGLALEHTLEMALAHLAIQWRNRRLHTGSANRLEQRDVATIRSSSGQLRARHGGLTPERLLDHFEGSRSPRPRELAALTRAMREACVVLDRALLARVPATSIAAELLRGHFTSAASQRDDEPGASDRLESVWAQPAEKRRGRLEAILRGAGFRNQPVDDGQSPLDDGWLDDLARSGAREAAARFGLVDERGERREG